MAVDSCLSTQKVRLPQNGSDFGGNPLAFNCAYELGSLLLHTGSGLIKSWSLKAKLAIWTDTTCDALSNIYIYTFCDHKYSIYPSSSVHSQAKPQLFPMLEFHKLWSHVKVKLHLPLVSGN